MDIILIQDNWKDLIFHSYKLKSTTISQTTQKEKLHDISKKRPIKRYG
jgi:hypothetical protein